MDHRDSVQDGLLEARAADAVRLAANGGRPRFVGFLDDCSAERVKKGIPGGAENVMFWGGYPEAERVMLGAFPGYAAPDPEAFPLAAVTFSFRRQDRLTHRDFLGAILHAGLERSALGDILVEEGRAVVFCREGMQQFLLTQFEKIGGVGVRVSAGFAEPLPAAHSFAPFSAVVASPRLDCIAAAACGMSREKAADLIRAQAVQLNHEVCQSVSAEVKEGDVLSVRGEGRFILDRLGPPTKKGRLGAAGRKYI
jgi:RNA-binding protein YlmH